MRTETNIKVGDVVVHKSNPLLKMVVFSTEKLNPLDPYRMGCRYITLVGEQHIIYCAPEELRSVE